MRKTKRFLGLVIATILFSVSFSSIVYAQGNEKFGNLYEGKSVVGVYYTDGMIFYLDEEELKQVKEKDLAVKDTIQITSRSLKNCEMKPKNGGAWSSISKVSEGSPYLDYSKKKTVSPSVKGPATISKGYSASCGYTASASLSSSERSKIGGTWSVSSNSSFSVTFSVPRGKTGYVSFTPKYKKITARRISYVNATVVKDEKIYIYQPVKAGSYADGLYELSTY